MQPERPVPTTLAFHASRIVIDLGVILAMASMSMTFVNSPAGNRSALAADAFPAVLLLLPIFAVTLIPDHSRPLHPVLGWLAMVLGLAALPYAFVKMLDAGVLADSLGGSVGLGPRVLLFGCVVTLLGIGVGLYRDIMGWPSGGTPSRTATVRPQRSRVVDPDTRRGRASQPQPKHEHALPPTTGDADTAPTRVIPPTRERQPAAAAERPAPQQAQPEKVSGEAPAQVRPEATAPRPASIAPPVAQRPQLDSPAPRPAAPTPVALPDRGENPPAEASTPPRRQEPNEDLLTTAERADAALDEHFLSLFDSIDDDNDDPGSDR